MVLCKFFQQGSCRFGSKCANEHLDVKQVVKTDVEAAINGKQWPLSTYGPFKDKPSIPNFIEDQSFEEVRMLCYEAKQKNFFDQFHQQFNKEAMEASNKMKALLQMSPDIVDVITSIYEAPSDMSSNGVNVGNNATNPFGLSNSAASSGIFAKKAGFAQPQPASMFAQPSTTANSIFAVGNNTNPQPNTSLFGQPQAQSNTSGLFSQQNKFLQQTQQNFNIFSQPTPASQPQTGLFAQASQTLQQQSQPQSLFSQSAQQTATPGIYTQSGQPTQNIFRPALQQPQQTNPNIFQQNLGNSGSQQQHMNSNIFQQNPTIMAQPQQTQNQQPPSGLFQQAALQIQNPVVQTNQLLQANSILYSRLEDLTSDEIEAFKADCFLPGKIPFNPPSIEFIN